MVIYNRFPSRQDIVSVFAACLFPVYSWSILVFFNELTGLLYYVNVWDIIGIFAYTQAFAFLESSLLLLILLLLAIILPARFLRDQFVAQGSMVVFMLSIFALGYHVQQISLSPLKDLREIVVYLVLIGLLGLFWLLIARYKRLQEAIKSFIERVAILLYLYIPVTLLSIVIIILRNYLGGMK